MFPLYLILYNIRSTYNVGAILRTADGAGVARVYCTGYTPTPLDRFGRKRKDIAKVALGAEDTMPWDYVEEVRVCIRELKEKGVQVVAVEQHAQSVPYSTFAVKKPTAFVVGEEVHGIPSEILAECDVIVEIPMWGNKESLNVSVATGIVLYHARIGE
jgi:tRNA G18 (ribose-2'-O)-methylase SpoU